MSSSGRRVRSRRSAPVVVTRSHSPSGSAIARAFTSGGQQRVVAVDDDLTSPAVADRLRGARAVVHVLAPDDLRSELADPDRRDRVVREVETLVLSAAATAVPHLVLITSAMVHGARADNPLPLGDDAPRRVDGTVGLVADLAAAEEALERSAGIHPGLLTTVVRPAALVHGTDTILTRHVAAPRLLRLKEAAPAWQLCHVDDLAAAVVHVVDGAIAPAVGVGCEGWLDQTTLEERCGLRAVELSLAAAIGIAHRLHRVGTLPSPATDLAFVAHPWAVGSGRLRAAGWRPAYDNEDCVRLLLEDARTHRMGAARRFDRKDGAAIGAASAAVAVGATAAIMRRRRKGTT